MIINTSGRARAAGVDARKNGAMKHEYPAMREHLKPHFEVGWTLQHFIMQQVKLDTSRYTGQDAEHIDLDVETLESGGRPMQQHIKIYISVRNRAVIKMLQDTTGMQPNAIVNMALDNISQVATKMKKQLEQQKK